MLKQLLNYERSAKDGENRCWFGPPPPIWHCLEMPDGAAGTDPPPSGEFRFDARSAGNLPPSPPKGSKVAVAVI